MKIFYTLMASVLFLLCSSTSLADVTLSSSAVAAGNIAQGSTDNILNIVKMDVTTTGITVNSIQFTLTGTHDNNDLTVLNVYYNPTTPSLTGASLQAINIPATFAAGHVYNSSFNYSGSQAIAAGSSGYFIITVSANATATNGNTIKIDAAANPVSFGYTTVPTVVNNQTDISGIKTLLAAAITYSTTTLAAANIAQGSTDNILYIVKTDVTLLPVTISRIQFTLTGTHDNDDLTVLNVYYNPTAASLTGASLMAINAAATYAAPHAYDLSFNFSSSQTIAAGGSGYFIIAATVSSAGTNGNTVKVNGAANPVSFTYSTGPTITNNQTDVAATRTIVAAAVTLTTITNPASNIAQGSTDNILYAVKVDVTALPVVMNRIQFTLTGTHDNDDLTVLNVYYNPSAPTVAGASVVAINNPATYAAPHAYDLFFNFTGSQTIAAGSSGYFIITASVNSAGTNGNTVKVNGAANPISFTYTTSPTITNSQTDIAGIKTILAAGVTLTSVSSPASNLAQGSTDNILYAVKVDVTALPVVMNRIQFTLTGTHDNDDLTVLNVYYNPSAPTVAGASVVAINNPATYAAPHAYDLFFNFTGSQTIAAGSSGYFIITASVNSAGTNGNTVKVNAAANPISFSYTTSPGITNNQTDIAGIKTILGASVTLTSTSLAAANIAQGSTDNILYAVKMDVTAVPVVISRIQFTLTGTIDNNDLTVLNVYYNPATPTLAGASLMAINNPATFAAPYAYDLYFNFAGTQTIAAGGSGYFIITATVSGTGTNGNTVKVNAAANPISFTYSTSPGIINNQTDIAGIQTIQAVGITISTSPLAPANINQGTNDNIIYVAKTDVTVLPVTISRIQFNITGTMDNNDLTVFNIYYNPTAPTLTGATLMAINNPATFAAPHAYDLFFNYSGSQSIAAGGSGYFIITANVDAAGTVGNTVKINGAADPVTFTYSTGPTITNSQTDAAGLRTISSTIPLTLMSFAGNQSGTNNIQLKWTTSSEYNTKEFDVEWSDDGLRFTKIAILPAANYSSQLRQYSYLHKGPVDGNNYYRLKMVDNDGKFTYSGIIKITVRINSGKIIAFQNPFSNNLQLHVQSLKNEIIQLNLIDATGKRIATKTLSLMRGNNQVDWSLPNLPAGNYFISNPGGEFSTLQVNRL